jgi:hypothetical protein
MAATKDSKRLAHNLYMRKWSKSHPEAKAFYTQRGHASRRGVIFLMTFEEWWSVWQTSGKWEQRGRRRGQYVMARFGDAGPYSISNVRICTAEENQAEQGANISEETRRRISAAGKAKPPISEETRRRLSKAGKAVAARNPEMIANLLRFRWAHKRAQ